MLRSSFLGIVLVCLWSSVHLAFGVRIIDCPRYNFPQDRKERSNCDSYSPIALLTSTAKVTSAPELFIVVSKRARITCKTADNRLGSYVSCTVPKGLITMRGGPVYEDKYFMNSFLLRFDSVPNNTRVFGTQDYDKTAVGAVISFQKYAYPFDFNNPDSFARFLFHVEVNGNAPNLEFEKFGSNVLTHIRVFNTSATTYAENLLPWLLETFLPPYYVYPGSSENSTTTLFTPNTILLEASFRSHPYISYPQYQKYLMTLRTPVGQPLGGVVPLHSQGNRPVREIRNGMRIKYID